MKRITPKSSRGRQIDRTLSYLEVFLCYYPKSLARKSVWCNAIDLNVLSERPLRKLPVGVHVLCLTDKV